MRPLVCSSIAAFCTWGCGGAADIPNTPDLSELIAGYQNPTAQLDAPMAQTALTTFPPLDRLAAGFRAGRFPADDVADASDPSRPPSAVRVQGSINVTARCPGELSEPAFDPALNGTLSFTLGVAENRVLRGIGGDADHCVLHETILGKAVRVELDGSVAFDLGRDFRLGEGFSGTLLARFDSVTVADTEFKNVTARFVDGRVEHLFSLDGGTVIASLSEAGVTIRDRRGLWLCLETQTCAEQ